MSKEIKIVAYEQTYLETWDRFIDSSQNGTLFHKQLFLNYHVSNIQKSFRHLLFYQGDTLVAILPTGILHNSSDPSGLHHTLKSPFGASFGGWVTKESDFAFCKTLVQTLFQYAKLNSIQRILITPPPSCYSLHQNTNIEFGLLAQGFKLVNRDICQVVNLSKISVDEPMHLYQYSCQKQIRKAIREGVVIETNVSLTEFYSLLVADRANHQVIPTHTFSDLEKLRELICEDFILFGAYHQSSTHSAKKLIAGMLCFKVNSSTLLNFYTCQINDEAKFGGANLLVHHAIQWAKAKGFQYYDFGTSSLAMQPNEGLIRYKESFGSVGMFRDTYAWETE